MPNLEDAMADGMWRLSAAIGGVNFYEAIGDKWDDEAYNWASNTSISENQEAFNLCYEFDILENKLCSKLYEKVTVLGETYKVMDINYAKNNWEESILKALHNTQYSQRIGKAGSALIAEQYSSATQIAGFEASFTLL